MTSSSWTAAATFRRLIAMGAGLAVGAALGTPAPAAAAPPEGAYWHVKELLTMPQEGRFGTRVHPYSLVKRQITERWTTPDGRAWYAYRELGTTPPTPADKEAWRRAGSPVRWSESIDGRTVRLSTEPSKGHVGTARELVTFELAGQLLTYDEVQRLPADPALLKDWLSRAGRVGGVPASALPGWVAGTLPQLLHVLPAPKEVRDAAYQAMLTMPGVRADGDAKDELGRPGVAVVIEEVNGTGEAAPRTRNRLIVDTGRMALLAQEYTTGGSGKGAVKSSVTTLAEVGWTDARPAVPALP
ncbi:hypothetical protein ABT158_33465 [Nonomuraea sp. NPDC001636]|uniref:hypothetical protein n=1 Tax=Nonomuraea sp. NPDC001636 TaxID=3154391 RepID=UPI00332C513D